MSSISVGLVLCSAGGNIVGFDVGCDFNGSNLAAVMFLVGGVEMIFP